MIEARQLLLGHVVPACIALVVLALVRWSSRRGWNSAWAVPVAIGTAFTFGYYALHPVRAFPPQDQAGWLVYLVPVLMLVAAADSPWRAPMVVRTVLVGLLAYGLALIQLIPPSNPSVAPSQAIIISVAAIVSVTWISLDRLTARRGSREMSVVLLLLSLATSAILGMSGSQIYGLQGGTLAAVMGAVLIATLMFKGIAIERGAVLLFTFIWLALLINGHFWSNVSIRDAAMLLVAPLLGWLGEIPILRGRQIWKSAVRVGLVAAPLVIVVTLVGIQFKKDMEEFL